MVHRSSTPSVLVSDRSVPKTRKERDGGAVTQRQHHEDQVEGLASDGQPSRAVLFPSEGMKISYLFKI